MNSKKSIQITLFILLVSLVFTGCSSNLNPAPPTPEVDVEATQAVNDLRTEAAMTVQAAMTNSVASALQTASAPPPTRVNTNTPTASATASRTPFLAGSSTPTLTPTSQVSITLIVPTLSQEPPLWKCNLARTTPGYKAVLGKGEEFEVHWLLVNSGYNGWYNDNVTGAFRNGMVMHSGSGTFKLTHAALTGETYEVIMPMKAPIEAGAYSSVWVLKNKKEAFCWFSVDIVVE